MGRTLRHRRLGLTITRIEPLGESLIMLVRVGNDDPIDKNPWHANVLRRSGCLKKSSDLGDDDPDAISNGLCNRQNLANDRSVVHDQIPARVGRGREDQPRASALTCTRAKSFRRVRCVRRAPHWCVD